MSSTDKRLIELETRSAEQQQTIDELSDMISHQWKKIDDLMSRMEVMRGRVLTLEDKIPDDEAPPPHY